MKFYLFKTTLDRWFILEVNNKGTSKVFATKGEWSFYAKGNKFNDYETLREMKDSRYKRISKRIAENYWLYEI